ncbi:MAG: biotin/lipoyl-containing protein [Gemmatimonadota bacterium]
MKYFVTIGGREHQVTVDGTRVFVDGEEYQAHLTPIPGTPLRHLLLGDRSFTLPFVSQGKGQWAMAFQGGVWEAEVVDERTRHIRSLTGPGDARKNAGVLKAPMPGLVIRVDVVAGQAVPVGASLVVLEAMKMQNELRSQSVATVSAVKVEPGQAVEKGQILVEFAPE